MIRGIGIDLVDSHRFSAHARDPDHRLARKILTGREFENYLHTALFDRQRFLSVHWAVKEAVTKCCPEKTVFTGIELGYSDIGAPRVTVAAVSGTVLVTVSHDAGFVTAAAVFQK